MSRRQIASTFSSAIRTSSQPSTPRCTTCIYQQSRGIVYGTYEQRRQAAKEWVMLQGKKFLRPRKGQTNYLGKPTRERPGDFSLKNASAGQDGMSEDPVDDVETPQSDPWDDAKAVEALKRDFLMNDADIQAKRQEFNGLTPDILRTALADKLEDAGIRDLIQTSQSNVADAAFDTNAAARREASQMLAQQTGTETKPRAQNLRPFPNNPYFKSQPVLSEELREMIYLKVVRDQMTVRTVSTLMGVSMERVGAVVRMKEMERQWVQKGKPLAVPYSRAVLDMVPTTPYVDQKDASGRALPQPPHESINEIPVHPHTTHQTFVSVPESRQFTREDAAKAFSPRLKSADERIPHPELLAIEKVRLSGAGPGAVANFAAKVIEEEKANLKRQAEREAKMEARHTQTYKGKRWDFKFTEVSAEDAGRDGRGKGGVGWRYGNPHNDRKRGTVKIPETVA